MHIVFLHEIVSLSFTFCYPIETNNKTVFAEKGHNKPTELFFYVETMNMINSQTNTPIKTDFEVICHALKLHCDIEEITNMGDIHIVSASRDVMAVAKEIEQRPLAIQQKIILLKKILTNEAIKTDNPKKLLKIKRVLIDTGFSLATH